jgi:hypothetical protein
MMRQIVTAISGFLCLLLLIWSSSIAQEKHFYFYKSAQTRGSDAGFTPFTLLINGTFDALRLSPDAGHDLTALKWNTDFKNVWNSLSDPVGSIRAYGWENFRRQELLNLSFDVDDLQFIPNFADHIIGYGMQYAKVTEWYDAHGYESPVLLGIATSLVYQLMNEVVQNSATTSVNVDCIADVYIFNTLGFALFSSDDVKRFFSETMQLNDWSLQPLYIPRNHHLENAGQEFVMRYALPFAERFAPFICWGVNSIAGFSYRYDDANRIAVGLGNAISGMTTKYRGEFLSATPNFERAIGVFWDNDGSLLAGLIVSGQKSVTAQLNVYPGFIDLYGIRPGCYLGVGGREGLVVGVTFLNLPVSLGLER